MPRSSACKRNSARRRRTSRVSRYLNIQWCVGLCDSTVLSLDGVLQDERGNLHSVNTKLQDELRTTKASLTFLQAEHDQQRIQVAAYNKALERAKEERLELNITVDFLTHFQEGLLDLIGQRDAQVAQLEASLAESAPSDA